MARHHPNRVLLIDWRRFSAGHAWWFGEDNLHVNDTGATAFARLIRRRARGVIAPPGRALRRLRRIKPRRRCHHRVLVLRGRVSCRSARKLARQPRLGNHGHWQWFDWRPVNRGPWRDVYVRHHRRQIVARR